jgi:hypothetical protein
MPEFNKPTPEDDAFNHVEMMSRVKQENVKAQMQAKTQQEFYDELRNGVIEEVAQHIEKMKVFGNDTISSFAIFIRSMKR